MPRMHLDPISGRMTPIPADLPDDQIPGYVARSGGQAEMRNGNALGGLANIIGSVAGRIGNDGAAAPGAPIGGQTFPQGFQTTAGLGLQGTMDLLQMQQQSNVSDVGAQLQQRAQMEKAMEAEKDRAAQIKLEEQRLKNQKKLEKMREELALDEAKKKARQDIRFGRVPSPEDAKKSRLSEMKAQELENQLLQFEVDQAPERFQADQQYREALTRSAAARADGGDDTDGGLGPLTAGLKEDLVRADAANAARQMAKNDPTFIAWKAANNPTPAQEEAKLEPIIERYTVQILPEIIRGLPIEFQRYTPEQIQTAVEKANKDPRVTEFLNKDRSLIPFYNGKPEENEIKAFLEPIIGEYLKRGGQAPATTPNTPQDPPVAGARKATDGQWYVQMPDDEWARVVVE